MENGPDMGDAGGHSEMNAVADALSEYGIRHIDMPATRFKIWRAIQEARAPARKNGIAR
jgi:carbon-monoxide dehydrogenase large subunit